MTEARQTRDGAPARGWWHPLAIWAAILAAGIVLISGRYDWSLEGGRFAERGLLLSSYLFVIVLPTAYYLARRVLLDARAAAGLAAVLFVILTAPYEWLGLDDLYYYAERPQVFTIEQIAPSLEFLPGGMLRVFPYDWALYPLLFAAGAAAIWAIWWLRRRAGRTAGRTIPTLLTIALALICVQSFTHSSIRGPYTYLAYFQREAEAEHWYHVYHFEDGSGATQADQFAFSPLEDYFQGAPRDGDNELIRRPLAFYMAAQVSYFANTIYGWTVLNCLFWLIAVLATWRWVSRLAGDRAGRIAAALTLFGPGFVAFVSTPAMYMQAYTAVIVALCLFEELVIRFRGRDLARLVLFTGALTLCALVYDLLPLLVVLFAYGLSRGVAVRPLGVSLLAALLFSRGFVYAVTGVLEISVVDANEAQIADALSAFKDFVGDVSPAAWYSAVTEIVPSYFAMLLQAFFVLPLAIAAFGVPRLRDRSLRILVGGLFLIGFATIALFQIAELPLGHAPRLLYPAFPAVYLLAAIALDAIGRPRQPLRAGPLTAERLRGALGVAAPWLVVGVMFCLVNLDIFGFPTQYVEFFVANPPRFLP